MSKKIREIQRALLAKAQEAQSYLDAETPDTEKAAALMAEADDLQKQLELQERIDKASALEVPVVVKDTTVTDDAEAAPVDSTKAFADAARRGFKSMNEGTMADGGYTVPEDIVTTIQHLRDAKFSLLSLVTVQKVSTNKGARTFKARAQQTGFTKVGEGGKIGAKATPQFTRISYEIEKYGGYFPVTNELLTDSDANITAELTTWIGDESRVTANKLIMEQINTKSTTAIATLDDVKKALNVTLGAAFKSTSAIVTNDDGLQWLDTLKDSLENYILQPNPADPMKLQLCAGATVVPVHVIGNADLPTGEDGIPFIIGDLREGVVYWDRQQMTIKTSDVAVAGELNAFEEDLTLFRAIEREDVTTRDTAAFVNGRVAIA